MLTDLLKSQMFNIMFSFAVGIGIIAILRPVCKGEACNQMKAPPIKEWDGYVYRMGSKCYEYKSDVIECPSNGGSIESFRSFSEFQGDFERRQSRLAY